MGALPEVRSAENAALRSPGTRVGVGEGIGPAVTVTALLHVAIPAVLSVGALSETEYTPGIVYV